MSSSARNPARATRQPLSFEGIHGFLSTLFGDDLHTRRVKSVAEATPGVIQSVSLALGLIGRGPALARGRPTRHAVRQVDRLLSNRGIEVDGLLVHWVPYVVGTRGHITVALDRTSFVAVDQATQRNRRNGYEYQAPVRLAQVLSAEVGVRVVARSDAKQPGIPMEAGR